jgi:hypothetical protein
LSASVDFDVRKLTGDPLDILTREAQLHDLVVGSFAPEGKARTATASHRLSPHDYIELLRRGVQPLLILRGAPTALGRVLLVYDGTSASGSAIRTYLSQLRIPEADHRLLAVGKDEPEARKNLREMADYCRTACQMHMEMGLFCGRPRRALSSYLHKWEADLVVLGVPRGFQVLNRLLNNAVHDVLRRSSSSLFVTS